VFHRPHPQRDKFPTEPRAIPLLVFIHGLGGSVAQWHPLLTTIVDYADCLAVDLPGCGLSQLDPKDWEAYTQKSLVHLLATIIEHYRDKDHDQRVVLICHSMGCSLGTYLCSQTSPFAGPLSDKVDGMIAMCTLAEPPDAKQAQMARRVISVLPVPIFNLWRALDRQGGVDSKSITRFTGDDADLETRRLQLRFNRQSRSATFLRMIYGCLADYSSGIPVGGIPGESVWSGVKLPLFLVYGEADHITSPENMLKIAAFLGKKATPQEKHNFDEKLDQQMSMISVMKDKVVEMRELGPDAISVPTHVEARSNAASVSLLEESSSDDRSTIPTIPQSGPPAFKTYIFPAPASHGLLYATQTVRPLSGFIQSFLSKHIDYRLSIDWQLQYLTSEAK